jgi:hypothetical protein
MTKYTATDIERMEADKGYYGLDQWTGAIVIALESEAKWYAFHTKLPNLIKGGKLTSRDTVRCEIEKHITTLLYPLYKQECSFRWCQLIQNRVSEYFWGVMVDEYFDGIDPLR